MTSQNRPLDIDTAIREAQERFRDGQLSAAIRLFHMVLDQEPDHVDVLLALGRLHQLVGNLHKAVHYYRMGTRLAPETWALRYHLGHVLIRIGQYAEAVDHLRAVAEAGMPGARNLDRLLAYAGVRARDQDVVRFSHDGTEVRFAVDGDNVGLDMFYANGEFFEQAELDYTRYLLPPDAVIVDVGANAGNHLVYYAKFMSPRKILPIEPHPGAIDSLVRNIQLNGIDCIDPRWLGFGVGPKSERMDLAPSQAGDMVTIRLVRGGPGNVRVEPLDALVTEKIDFLKIDVEGMEIGTLNGARQTLAQFRPTIMIEVSAAKDPEFQSLLGQLNYAVDRSFDGEGYKNYFLRAR